MRTVQPIAPGVSWIPGGPGGGLAATRSVSITDLLNTDGDVHQEAESLPMPEQL